MTCVYIFQTTAAVRYRSDSLSSLLSHPSHHYVLSILLSQISQLTHEGPPENPHCRSLAYFSRESSAGMLERRNRMKGDCSPICSKFAQRTYVMTSDRRRHSSSRPFIVGLSGGLLPDSLSCFASSIFS